MIIEFIVYVYSVLDSDRGSIPGRRLYNFICHVGLNSRPPGVLNAFVILDIITLLKIKQPICKFHFAE
jgi:hypothetical protein